MFQTVLPTEPQKQALISDIWPILLVLVVITVAGFILIGVVRRWMRGEDGGESDVGFTLSDLRRLNREGKLSDEELRKAEEQMISRVRAMASDSEVRALRPAPHGRRSSEPRNSAAEEQE